MGDKHRRVEPDAAEFRRRLTALEAHIADLEERLTARGVFSGPLSAGDVVKPTDPRIDWSDPDA